MKIVLDNVLTEELKEFLLSQNGIISVELLNKDSFSEINIEFDKRITPEIIMKFIDLFENNKYSQMLGFDKKTQGDFKTLKYTIEDMCCEYCYKNLVYELFVNEFVKSVKSNFDFNKPAFNIEFIIEYDQNYKEDDLIKYINNVQ